MVVLPYIEGTTDKLSRILRKHNIFTAFKPHRTFRNILVHPKDKINKEERCGVVYGIPCRNCEFIYVGETSRQLKTRIAEHKDEVDKVMENIVNTRSRRKESTTELHKSAITDHAVRENHIIDWEGVKILDKDSDFKKRGIREALAIRKQGKKMNRDEGRYHLSHIYDTLLRSEARGQGAHQ